MQEQKIISTTNTAFARIGSRLGSLLTFIILVFTACQSVFAQDSATQDLVLSVSAVSVLATSGDPEPLVINDGVAGMNALTTVSDASTNYDITQNHSARRAHPKITAKLNSRLPAGFTLRINLESTLGNSLGTVDISGGRVRDVVRALANGADEDQPITYTFSASASSGMLASIVTTVTLTVTN